MNLNHAVSIFFEWETRTVTKWPLLFIAAPILFTATIVSLAAYNPQLNTSKQSLEMFLPDQMESLRHLHELMQLFPPRNALRDSYSLFGSKFAYFIYEDITDNPNVLSPDKISKIAKIHRTVMDIVTEKYQKFTDLCYKEKEDGACLMHPVLYALDDDQALLAIQLMARYPLMKISNATIDNAVVFGGVRLANRSADRQGSRPIEAARALRLAYVLGAADEADLWIRAFLDTMKGMRVQGADLFFTSSRSLPDEMQRNGELLVPWMPWMVAILILFCAAICFASDAVRSQPFIGLSAMFNAFLAVCAAVATLIYVQYPFLHMVLIMPFLIISIGVDNMFLMLKSWRIACAEYEGRLTKAAHSDAVLVYAITDVSVSLMITSLTDGFSFLVGSLSDFIAVRVFCVYCSLAIAYMFAFQITLLTGLMVMHCRREIGQRHCLTFLRVGPPSSAHSLLFTLFCGRTLPKPDQPSSGDAGIWRRVAYAYQIPGVKAVCLFVYIAYLTVSVHFVLDLPLGLDLKLLTPDNSYAALEIRAQERLFADYGAFCFAVIKTHNLELRKAEERQSLVKFYKLLSAGHLVSPGEFWLETFENVTESEDFHSEKDLLKQVVGFLEDDRFNKFRSDIKFNKTGQIEAIKMVMRIRKLGAENDPPRAKLMRRLMKKSKYDGFVYDTSFLLVDQQRVTLTNVVLNVCVAVGVMLAIAVLLIPRAVSALAIALCILSINLGVVAGLAAARTRLDIISMITIVMSVGFSVDYATHITFHYLTQRRDRLQNALRVVAFPILQAATSTLVGVAILGVVPSYMIRTFVLTVVFVVLIGLVHAVLFLPVLLCTVVPDSEHIRPYQPAKPVVEDEFGEEKGDTFDRFQPRTMPSRLDCYIRPMI